MGPSSEQIATWYPRLFRTALRMTGSAEEAGELTQQAFLQALSRWDRFDGRALPSTWLHRILVNCVGDWFRRKANAPTPIPDEHALVPAGDGGRDAADELHRREQMDHLRAAIRDLPQTLRPAFIVTVLDGYTYQEAAELLSVPVGTIASRVHEARRQLQGIMRRSFSEE